MSKFGLAHVFTIVTAIFEADFRNQAIEIAGLSRPVTFLGSAREPRYDGVMPLFARSVKSSTQPGVPELRKDRFQQSQRSPRNFWGSTGRFHSFDPQNGHLWVIWPDRRPRPRDRQLWQGRGPTAELESPTATINGLVD
jgi:hypothetical protein